MPEVLYRAGRLFIPAFLEATRQVCPHGGFTYTQGDGSGADLLTRGIWIPLERATGREDMWIEGMPSPAVEERRGH